MTDDSQQEPLETMTAMIDHGELVSLFRDVAALAKVIGVNVKGPAMSPNADAYRADLPEALQLLESGRARGVQLRYQHNDSLWMDTLSPTTHEDQWQLVRIQHRLDDGG